MTLQFGITFVVAIALLFIILKILSLPMKLIIKLVVNGVIGGITIWLINLVGANFGFTIALNWITALIVGILGIPGAIILAIIQIFI
ncbi:MAG: pro-sigmaK processing inhibitor BofA [Clostridia bacterium]|nr:pro-sigmaK processing inhibitor BofA [Clostridia bacterium]